MNARILARASATALLAFASSTLAEAQIQGLPLKSPRASIQQTVGITDLEIRYHRPRVQSRAIWGDLVPYDEVWRAGANENTLFRTSDPIRIEGVELPAGTYGLHAIPGEDSWTIVLSGDSDKWGSYSYDAEKDALRVVVKPRLAAHRESLEYTFQDAGFDSATLILGWEKLEVPLHIEVDTPTLVLARIEKQLAKDATPASLLSAASFCLQYQVGVEDALYWCEDALAIEETGGGLAFRAAALDSLGRDAEAADCVGFAIELLGDVNEIARAGARLQNLGRHRTALRFLNVAAERVPESGQIWNLVADSQAALGDKDRALASYRRALEFVQGDFQRGVIERAIAALEGGADTSR